MIDFEAPDVAIQALPSKENAVHPAHIDLFDPNRWPRKPYCKVEKDGPMRIRPFVSALKQPYIQANPPHLRVWSIFDIDDPYAHMAWEKAHLPPPSWTTVNRVNGHAHLAWGLSTPVLVDGFNSRKAPIRYLCAIESMMRAKLNADVGYSGLLTKNPAHPIWHTLKGPRLSYELQELAEYLPGLEKHIPRHRKIEEIGLGRNITLFDHLRQWAYKHVREYKDWNAWISAVNSQALIRNGDFGAPSGPMDGREVWHIAKSVAKWTYQRFDVEVSDARFRALQRHRGRAGGIASGQTRLAINEDKRSRAQALHTAGQSLRKIARELDINASTVQRWVTPEGRSRGYAPAARHPPSR